MTNKPFKAAFAASLLLLSSLASAALQSAQEELNSAPSGAAMVADLLVGRPLGLIVTVLGLGVFVVSLPLTALQGTTEDSAHRLVGEPVDFTFKRPLGRMN